MSAPICAEHHVFMESVCGGFACPRCVNVIADAMGGWTDEEGDVNDYKGPEHIYPRLHGTGGIGPGHWQKRSLARAQEDHADATRARATNMVRTIRTYDHFGIPFQRIVEKVVEMLR